MFDINIKVEKSIARKRWDDFLDRISSYNLFSCIEYYELVKAEIFFVIAYNEENTIVGGIICRIRGGVFPYSIFSKSLWIESGLLVINSNPDIEKHLKMELIKSVEKEARNQKCILIKFNHWCMEKNPEIFLSNNFDIIFNSTFISDLTLSQDELYSKLDRNIKAAIKKAKKGQLKFNIAKADELCIIHDFYNIYKFTQKRAINYHKNISMTLKPFNLIKGLLQLEKLNSYVVYTEFDDKIAAGIILVKNGDTLIGYIAASDIELNRKFGASSLLFWESMLWAKKQGFKYFDFGGIPNNQDADDPAYGVYRFKKNFGGHLTQYSSGQKFLSPFKGVILNHVLSLNAVIRFLMKFNRNL